jgi:hypothetical protein
VFVLRLRCPTAIGKETDTRSDAYIINELFSMYPSALSVYPSPEKERMLYRSFQRNRIDGQHISKSHHEI